MSVLKEVEGVFICALKEGRRGIFFTQTGRLGPAYVKIIPGGVYYLLENFMPSCDFLWRGMPLASISRRVIHLLDSVVRRF